MNADTEGHGEIVELLLDNGADANVTSSGWLGSYIGWQAIHFATFNGHLDVAKLIAKKHPKVLKARNDAGNTPLSLARLYVHNHIVHWLQKKKV